MHKEIQRTSEQEENIGGLAELLCDFKEVGLVRLVAPTSCMYPR